jgi:hypothetical protein
MIINMITFAGREIHYIDQTLDSLSHSDGRDLPLNFIVGSYDTSHIEQYRGVGKIVDWDQASQWQIREGNRRHNCNVNEIRALKYGDDDYCLCCEDDILFDKHWYSNLMATVDEIGPQDYVLNLGQDGDQVPGRRYATHTNSYLCGSQAIFYPSKRHRNQVAEYCMEHINSATIDQLIGRFGKQHSALYNTIPPSVSHIGEISCFHVPSSRTNRRRDSAVR